MTRRYPRSNISRTPHTPCSKRLTIRHNSLYYLRSFLFSRVLLSLLSLKPRPDPWARGLLTPGRNYCIRPIWGPSAQYSRPFILWGNSHLSTSQYYRRWTKTSYSISSTDRRSRPLLHIPSGYGVLRSSFYNCRWSLRRNLFRSNWIPRTSCYYWLNILSCLLITSNSTPLYNTTPFRLWSRRLILTLRRRRMIIPIYCHLLMRLIIFLVQISICDFQSPDLG